MGGETVKKILIIAMLIILLAGCSNKEEMKETKVPLTETNTTEMTEVEVTFKEDIFELNGEKYSIELPEQFVKNEEEKEIFEAETEAEGIYIYSINKENFTDKEELISKLEEEAKTKNTELEEYDIRKGEKKVGKCDSVELKYSIKNEDTMNTIKTYIIDKDEKEYLIVSLVGYETFYSDIEKIDRILNSFKVIEE